MSKAKVCLERVKLDTTEHPWLRDRTRKLLLGTRLFSWHRTTNPSWELSYAGVWQDSKRYPADRCRCALHLPRPLCMCKNLVFPPKTVNRCHLQSGAWIEWISLYKVMASSKVTEVQPCSSKEQEPQRASSKPSTLSHNKPIPINLDKSKLDWLLQINEQLFEAELRTVVSTLASINSF